MTADVAGNDIDRFIKDQKTKLAQERKFLADDGGTKSPDNKRKTWDRSRQTNPKIAEQNRPPSVSGRTGLLIGNNDDDVRKQQRKAERNKEYNEMMQKKTYERRYPVTPPMTRPPARPNKENEAPSANTQAYQIERFNHDSALLQVPTSRTTEAYNPQFDYEANRRALQEQRKKDYNEFVTKIFPMGVKREKTISDPKIYPFDHEIINVKRKQKLRSELRQSYQDFLTKQALASRRKPASPVEDMGLPVGQYEEMKRNLQNDIKKEYRAMLAQQKEEKDRLTLLQLGLADEVALPSEGFVAGKHYPSELNGEHYPRNENPPYQTRSENMKYSQQHQRQKQLEYLEDIHRREEELRRKLDVDVIRESDQENTLSEEIWRKHQPQNTEEIRPTYFTAGDYEKYREKLNEDRKREYNHILIQQELPRSRYPSNQRERQEARQHVTFNDKQQRDRRLWREPSNEEDIGLPIGGYGSNRQRQEQSPRFHKKQLITGNKSQEADVMGTRIGRNPQTKMFSEEKRRDYNELLQHKRSPVKREWREPSADGGRLDIGEREKIEIAKQKHAAEVRRTKAEYYANMKKTREFEEADRQMMEEEKSVRDWRERLYDESRHLPPIMKLGLGIPEKQNTGRTPRVWKDDFHEALPLGQYEETRRLYNNERSKDYQKYLKQKPTSPDRRLWPEPSDSSMGLELGKYNLTDKYKQRQKNTNEIQREKSFVNHGTQTWRGPSYVPQLFFGNRDEEVERVIQSQRDYEEVISKLDNGRGGQRSELPPKPPTPGGFLNKLGRDDGKKNQLSQQRQHEYNQFLADRGQRGRRNEGGEYGASIPGLKGNDSTKYYYLERPKSDSDVRGSWSKPWFERNNSYVDVKPFSQSKIKQRNEEYNEFLKEKGGQKRPPAEAGAQPEGGIYATLPGLNYEGRNTLSELERNKEYNDFLRYKIAREDHLRGRSQVQEQPPGAPRKGWATPTYEEILQQKRQEEAKYRRFDDPEYVRPGMKAYASEGALHTLDGERRSKELNPDLDTRLHLNDDHRSILDDPLWLSPRRGENYDRDYGPASMSRLKDYNAEDTKDSRPSSPSAPRKTEAGGTVKQRYVDPPRREQGPPPRNREPGYYATLPVGEQRERRSRASDDDGNQERLSAQQRKKEQYKRELQQQMQEANEAKRREKLEDMKVNATGANDPMKGGDKTRGLGTISAPPPQQHVVMMPQPTVPAYTVVDPTPVYNTRLANFDQLSPRSEAVLGRRSLYRGDAQWDQIQKLDDMGLDMQKRRYTAPAPSNSNDGILETGFESLLMPPKVASIKPPPELEYQPFSFVTGGGSGYSAIDEAYYKLGSRNPLELDIAGAAHPSVTAVAAPQPGVGAAGGIGGGGSTTRVQFTDRVAVRQPPGGGVSVLPEGADPKAKSRAQAQALQVELARQIEENKMKKAKEKAEQEYYDMKLEEEAKNYNPYGKGGAGAPMKDDRGQTVADLRAMRKGYTPGPPTSFSPRPPSPRDDKIKTPPTQTTVHGDPSHARGGHGIFGQPKTDSEKYQSNVYRDDLQRQIESRKAQARLEKERERYEEEKELRRIEAERQKMQEEYEQERKKIKEKEDEARRKNEELMKQAEERRKETERERRELEDERRRQQEAADRERLEREKAERVQSPPLPAAGKRQAAESSRESPDPAAATQVSSPPIPAARTKAALESRPQSAAKQPDETVTRVSSALSHRLERARSPVERRHSPIDRGPSTQRAPSADILNSLAQLKHQLASERGRVENMLERTENEPEVFDPRLAQRPPPVPRAQRELDVFEMARNRSTVPVRRAPTADTNPNPAYLQEFRELKQADTDSRQEFKRHYPYDPTSDSHLEHQQAALIRQQEDNLRAMRDRSKFEKALPNMEPRDLGLNRHGSLSPQPMLQSNSAFIDVAGMGPVFPDDLDDLPRRNDSARQRRRDRLFTSPRPGSVTSLDVDQIARKNEQRLRTLKDMQGDDLSLNDPDDVLDRFVSKQSHMRPPTSQTLQDDSWLQAGSKLSRF